MKKIVVIFVGCLSCSSVLGSLPPSHTMISSQKSTVVSVTQDRATATASIDFSPSITVNVMQDPKTQELDEKVRKDEERRARSKAKAEAARLRLKADKERMERERDQREFWRLCQHVPDLDQGRTGRRAYTWSASGTSMVEMQRAEDARNVKLSRQVDVQKIQKLSLKYGWEIPPHVLYKK